MKTPNYKNPQLIKNDNLAHVYMIVSYIFSILHDLALSFSWITELKLMSIRLWLVLSFYLTWS